LSSLALVLLLGIGPSAQTIPSVPANPDDGKEWLELARQRLAAKEFPEAIAAYRRAGELGSLSPADVQVEIAAT